MQSGHVAAGDRRRASRGTDDTGARRRATDGLVGTLERSVQLGSRVARGATSHVHRGYHRELHLPVAVKVLDERYVDDEGILARLEREARVLASLRDPGIVHVFDLARLGDGRPALVMEWLDGESLEQRLKRETRLAPVEALRIACAVAGALAYAHARGVTHRDVKPSNVMLVPQGGGERTILIDFGVARGPGASIETATGGLLGTPAYMAPEQAKDSSRVGPAADVYAVGAMLFRMLTGEPPYPIDDPWATLHRLAHESPRALGTLCPDVPSTLSAIVDRCLSRDPSLRPRDANDLLRALEPLAGEELAEPPSKRAIDPRVPVYGASVALATSAAVLTTSFFASPLEPVARVLVVVAFATALAATGAFLAHERARAGAPIETYRRLASQVASAARVASTALALATVVAAVLTAFGTTTFGARGALFVGTITFVARMVAARVRA